MTTDRIAWGQTLFCDDLRMEVGGKQSLMGLYGTDYIVNADFPAMLPKLVIYVTYYEIAGKLSDTLNLRVYMPHDENEPSISVDIPRVENQRAWTPPPDPDSEKIISVHAPIVLSPIEIVKEGPIKVRMKCGSVTTRLGRLNVRKPIESELKFYASVQQQPFGLSQPVRQG